MEEANWMTNFDKGIKIMKQIIEMYNEQQCINAEQIEKKRLEREVLIQENVDIGNIQCDLIDAIEELKELKKQAEAH